MHTVIKPTYSLEFENSEPSGRREARRHIGSLRQQDSAGRARYQRRSDVFPAGSTTTQHATSTGVAGRWTSGVFQLVQVCAVDPVRSDTVASGELRSWWLGVGVKAGARELRVQGGPLRKSSPGTIKNNDAANFRLEAFSRTVTLPVASTQKGSRSGSHIGSESPITTRSRAPTTSASNHPRTAKGSDGSSNRHYSDVGAWRYRPS